jgi:hypothetical protein
MRSQPQRKTPTACSRVTPFKGFQEVIETQAVREIIEQGFERADACREKPVCRRESRIETTNPSAALLISATALIG